MGIYRYNFGVYGRLIRYIVKIMKETAVKMLLKLALNAAYIVQAAVMARPSRVRLPPCADFTHSAVFR